MEHGLLEMATLESDGFVLVRGVLEPVLADSLRHAVNEHLVSTIAAFDAGTLETEEAFGAIAPPAKMVGTLLSLTFAVNDAQEYAKVHQRKHY